MAEFRLQLAQLLEILLALKFGFAVAVLFFFLRHDFLQWSPGKPRLAVTPGTPV
jgi:hypothetical protein